jgi:hypothetical protein
MLPRIPDIPRPGNRTVGVQKLTLYGTAVGLTPLGAVSPSPLLTLLVPEISKFLWFIYRNFTFPKAELMLALSGSFV